MTEISKVLRLVDGVLVCGEKRVVLKAARARVFVRLLLDAAAQGRHLELSQWLLVLEHESLRGLSNQVLTLHRTQVLRVLREVDAAFAQIDPALVVVYPARCRTSGPWRLQLAGYVLESVVRHDVMHEIDDCAVFYRLCVCEWQQDCSLWVRQLCHVVRMVVNSDSLYMQNLPLEAAEVLSVLPEFELTSDGYGLLILRRARALKMAGEFAQARCLVLSMLDDPVYLKDSLVGGFARLFLARIDYDCAPVMNFASLLSDGFPLPSLVRYPDVVMLMQWHNLRALLLRRQLELSPRLALHQEAMRHLESAVYLALWSESLNQAQNFILNLAFHLQQMIEHGWVDAEAILDCYQLSLSLADKCGCGDHSIWDRIFFAQFYWHYVDHTSVSERSQSIFATDFDPTQEVFYLNSLQFLSHTHDLRQKVLMYLLYAKYAHRYLSQPQRRSIIEMAMANLTEYCVHQGNHDLDYAQEMEKLWGMM